MPSQLVRMAQTLDGKTIFVREDREDGAVRGTKGRSPRAGAEPGSGAFRGGGARPSHSVPHAWKCTAACSQTGLSASPKTWEGLFEPQRAMSQVFGHHCPGGARGGGGGGGGDRAERGAAPDGSKASCALLGSS